MELLNAANDNFKGLLEKYRFLLENNITVKMLEVPWEYSHSAVMDIEHTIEDKYFDTFR